METRELTKYRAVRKGMLNQYYLQFLTLVTKRTFWGSEKTEEVWQDIPDPYHTFLGFMSRENSHNLANQGYGYALNRYHAGDLSWFQRTYPYIEDFIAVYNRGHQKWLDDQAKDRAKPTVINF